MTTTTQPLNNGHAVEAVLKAIDDAKKESGRVPSQRKLAEIAHVSEHYAKKGRKQYVVEAVRRAIADAVATKCETPTNQTLAVQLGLDVSEVERARDQLGIQSGLSWATSPSPVAHEEELVAHQVTQVSGEASAEMYLETGSEPVGDTSHPGSPVVVAQAAEVGEVGRPPGDSVKLVSNTRGTGRGPAGAKGFYWVAFLSMLVSIDTSWRFFGEVLGITDIRERVVMFAVLEVALVACGYGMRANVHRSGRPGAPRLIAWLLCGLAAYMAWQLSGMSAGLARVALGPVLGLVMLHLALGIEIRAGQHKATTWARVGRELRERVLSRLGLSDDERDALARTRDRAARRVARLTLGKWVLFRSARVARALRASNVAHDLTARDRMLAELAAIRHADDLAGLDQPSPWRTTTDVSNY